jgi:hypothetical protein
MHMIFCLPKQWFHGAEELFQVLVRMSLLNNVVHNGTVECFKTLATLLNVVVVTAVGHVFATALSKREANNVCIILVNGFRHMY